MKEIYIILSSQEYDVANHQELWKEMAKQLQRNLVVANIPADYVISIIKGKKYRIKEAKMPVVYLSPNMVLMRPLLTIRPEIAPSWLHRKLANQFWEQLKREFPEIEDMRVNLLAYNAYWVKLLKGTHPNMRIAYYLFDEVRYNANDNSINKKRYEEDEYACKHSDIILTMTSKLAESRKGLNANRYVIGNGAVIADSNADVLKIQRSVAFIGNFRNWIDKELLRQIVRRKKDVLFAIIGSVEDDMQDYLRSLLNDFRNIAYFGKVPKTEMTSLYQMFDVVMVPYFQNDFIQATRPIKIVEAVLAGTPVVTIPMDGYQPSHFIRFATSADEFCKEIDYLLDHPINITGEEYRNFVCQNTWESKASKIIEYFKL